MRSDDGHVDGYLTEGDLNKHEKGINMVAWGGGIAVTVFTVAMVAALVSRATDAWEYPAIVGLGAVPLAYAIFSNVIVRQAQIAMFQRYQGQLVVKVNQLEEAASRDELTGLHNRRHFYQAIQNELGKALAASEPLAIMLMDLDGLKSVNDQFGYATGDAVLNNLGKVIVKHIRGSDIAARLGGDEFGVVMPATDKRGAFTLARRLWEELEQHPLYEEGDKRVSLTVSIGVSGYPWGGEDLEELLQWADADMYANKVSRRMPRESVAVEVKAHIDRLPDDYAGGI
ncbi:MAG TPA: GGDEF domain-containing protein [Dehalococcoidia bacterium]|nr:GGDEF domain-containing protein [Dehalococcoidia bacterium]